MLHIFGMYNLHNKHEMSPVLINLYEFCQAHVIRESILFAPYLLFRHYFVSFGLVWLRQEWNAFSAMRAANVCIKRNLLVRNVTWLTVVQASPTSAM